MFKSLATTLLVCGATALANGAMAQDAFLGQQEFAQRCAICHGTEGAGNGAVGELFSQKPKNLRLLAKENGGTFPYAQVFESIDGRRDVVAHGSSEMPIWGDYLMAEALQNRNVSEKDANLIIEARVLALVNYVRSLQIE